MEPMKYKRKKWYMRYKPAPKMAEFIMQEVVGLEEKDIPKGIREFVASNGEATVRLPDIVWVKKRLYLKGRRLHQYIKGTDMIYPSPPVQPRNPELEARCERLRWEQQEREYRAMTKQVDASRYKQPEESIAYQMKQINRQLIGVLQFVFSVAAGFLFGFLGLELILGGLDMRVRLLSGIGCALIIAVAEIYFLIMHLNAEDVMISNAEIVQPPSTPIATKEPLVHPQKNEGIGKTKNVYHGEGKLHMD